MSFEQIRQQTKPAREIIPPVELSVLERAPKVERFVCLSDIHNDEKAMQASLEQKGIVDENSDWENEIDPVQLVISGDSVNKQNPNHSVLKYLRRLQRTAPEGSSVTILVGNHELDLLARETKGEETGMKEKWYEYLGEASVVCKQGSVLFLHRYPSLELVEELAEQFAENNGDVETSEWNINQRFQEAVSTRKETPQDSLAVFNECDDGGEDSALKGLSPKEYYMKYGSIISDLLESMGVNVVVHGHKKQASGGQDFEEYLPSITMVNNDTAMSSDKNHSHDHRMASAEIKIGSEDTEITCAYKKSIKKRKAKPQIKQVTLH